MWKNLEKIKCHRISGRNYILMYILKKFLITIFYEILDNVAIHVPNDFVHILGMSP